MKSEIEIFKFHPLYNKYAASNLGKVINIRKMKIVGSLNPSGYILCGVSGLRFKPKTIQAHRFIWECFNGSIPSDKVIDHINDMKTDNRLCNLQLMTTQQNNKKAAKYRDYSFIKYNHQNRKCVKTINQQTKEVIYYRSMYVTQQNLRINAGTIKMACDNLDNVKSGISKKDGCHYKFEYLNKEYKCNKCCEVMKNSGKYMHNKKCDSQKP